MKNLLKVLLFISSGTLWASVPQLTVTLENLPSDKGQVLYLLFDNEKGFPDKDSKSLRQGSIDLKESKIIFIEDLAPGKYALSVIHDENENGKLDTALFGIPKEAFGFSNNPAIYFGPPDFKKARFKVKGDTSITIKMKSM